MLISLLVIKIIIITNNNNFFLNNSNSNNNKILKLLCIFGDKQKKKGLKVYFNDGKDFGQVVEWFESGLAFGVNFGFGMGWGHFDFVHQTFASERQIKNLNEGVIFFYNKTNPSFLALLKLCVY